MKASEYHTQTTTLHEKMSPLHEIQTTSTWDDFNRLHQRILSEFNRDFAWTSPVSSVQLKNEKDAFNVIVDSKDFTPEELKVSTIGNVLKIEGKHVEEENPGQGSSKYVSRQFSRSYTLPSDCKVTEMTSNFDEGKLTVQVPKSQSQERYVPIQVSKPKIDSPEPTPTPNSNVKHVKINVHETPIRSRLFQDNWLKPVQLFGEDFFSDSFWNEPEMTQSENRVEVTEDDEKFEFTFAIDDYKPQELKVSVLDDVLQIEGRHMDQMDEVSKKKSLSKQFSRSYVLPRHLYKMDEVESCLTKAGNLTVKVPKYQFKSKQVNIPINMI